jgi:hypothetical protein
MKHTLASSEIIRWTASGDSGMETRSCSGNRHVDEAVLISSLSAKNKFIETQLKIT